MRNGDACSDVRLLSGQPDRQGAQSRRLEEALRSRTSTVSSSPPTSAIRKSSLTKPTAARRHTKQRGCSVVGLNVWSCSQPLQALRRAGHALGLRLRRSGDPQSSCSTAPTTAAREPDPLAASVAAWNDEAHVIDNRRQYREKFPRLSRQSSRACSARRCPTPVSTFGPGRRVPDIAGYRLRPRSGRRL